MEERDADGEAATKPSDQQLRVIVRRLPANLTKEEFFEQVSSLPSHTNFSFVPADPVCVPFCRVYATFESLKDVLHFRDTFNGHTFVDGKGVESVALVELAPNQKAYPMSKDVGPLNGTIEEDADFLAFREKLENSDTAVSYSVESVLEEIDLREKIRLEPWKYMDKPPLAKFYDKILFNRKRMRELKRKQKEIDKQKKEADRQKRVEKVKKEREAAKKAAAENRKADGKLKPPKTAVHNTSTAAHCEPKKKPSKRTDKVEFKNNYTSSVRRANSGEYVYAPPYRRKGFRGKWIPSFTTIPEHGRNDGKILYESDMFPESKDAPSSTRKQTSSKTPAAGKGSSRSGAVSSNAETSTTDTSVRRSKESQT